MYTFSLGAFNGSTWEALCQQVFKKKYGSDGYQRIPPSPGDFGIEGFCIGTGHAYQCYCPDKHYAFKDLYEHQRDKITADLSKLKTYKEELQEILGGTKISVWRFVTPEIDANALLSHARTKEAEVRSWNLPFIAQNFSVQLQDADYYLLDINEILAAKGESLDFEGAAAVLPDLTQPHEIYEDNVLRKCSARLTAKAASIKYGSLVTALHKQTIENFLESDGYLREIERTAPTLYFRLVRLINEFEKYVVEVATTWSGPPEHLTADVRSRFEERLVHQLGPEITETTASKIARHMLARWLAVCSLDYE